MAKNLPPCSAPCAAAESALSRIVQLIPQQMTANVFMDGEVDLLPRGLTGESCVGFFPSFMGWCGGPMPRRGDPLEGGGTVHEV